MDSPYPNLSDADTSLIPRTIQDGGRTLTLADVQWQEAGGFYNATATYSGTASSKYATGYVATVEYKGEVTRTSCDTVLYTEIRFPELDVRFIAINDGVDSEDQMGNDFTPFRNLV